MHLAAERLVML